MTSTPHTTDWLSVSAGPVLLTEQQAIRVASWARRYLKAKCPECNGLMLRGRVECEPCNMRANEYVREDAERPGGI